MKPILLSKSTIGLNSYQLKMIALTTMIIDHTGIVFFPDDMHLRIIGRIAFILYAFMLAEGAHYTRNIDKYIIRLFIWAIISEIPFDLAIHSKIFDWSKQNIFFLLFLAVLSLKYYKRTGNIFYKIIIICITMAVAHILKLDYSWYGIAVIYTFYILKNLNAKYFATGILSLLGSIKIFAFQLFAPIGFIPILLYNGKIGKPTGRIYYSYYALHLLVFGMIKAYL